MLSRESGETETGTHLKCSRERGSSFGSRRKSRHVVGDQRARHEFRSSSPEL